MLIVTGWLAVHTSSLRESPPSLIQVMPMEERFALVERVRAKANAQVRALGANVGCLAH